MGQSQGNPAFELGDFINSFVTLGLCLAYLVIAIRKVYGRGWVGTVSRAIACIGLLMVIVQLYRFILFFTTFYSFDSFCRANTDADVRQRLTAVSAFCGLFYRSQRDTLSPLVEHGCLLALLKVLIADDSLVITELLAEQVRNVPGVELAGVANDGDEAIQLFHDVKPDIVLLDISMPRKGGLEVLKEVRTHDSSTVCIMFTADNSQTVREACFQAGADHYIVKTQFDDLLKIFELYVSKNQPQTRCEGC